MKKSTTDKVTDFILIKSLEKLLNIKVPPSCTTMSEALHYVSFEEGLLHLPFDNTMNNLIVIYERFSVVRDFVNSSINGKYANPTFKEMDNWDESSMILFYDDSFKSPNNLFVATHMTFLKKHITSPGVVITASFDTSSSKEEVIPYKQLISLKSFI